MTTNSERIIKMETEIKYIKESNDKDHQELFKIVTLIHDKLDTVIETKADKERVDSLEVEIKDINKWTAKKDGAVIIVVAIITFIVAYFGGKI